MSDSINLLRTEVKGDSRRLRTTNILRIISLIFLGFVGLISIILFILNSRISVSSVKTEEATVLQNISLQKEKASKYYSLNDRVKGIGEILKNRKNYSSNLNVLIAQVPDGSAISSLEIDKGNIALTVNSSSLLPLNKFLNNMIDLSINKHQIKNMTIESLSIDVKTGNYSLSIKAKI